MNGLELRRNQKAALLLLAPTFGARRAALMLGVSATTACRWWREHQETQPAPVELVDPGTGDALVVPHPMELSR